MNKFDVLIVGAGYAGLMCALRLAGRIKGKPVKIGVVNPAVGFVERVRLHEGLADGVSLLRPLDLPHVLKKAGIALIAGRVVSLDRAAQRVGVETAGAVCDVGYGRLVIAAGSHNRRDQIPGAVSVAYSLDADHPRGAAALRDALSANEHSRVLVIGGGATGIEVAAEISNKPHCTVILAAAGSLGAFATERVCRDMRKELEEMRVQIREGIKVTELTANSARTDQGAIAFDICVLASGFAVDNVFSSSGLAATPEGRIAVDPFLRAHDDPLVYAAGDAAMPSSPCGAPPRMSVFFALTTGAHVADAIADQLGGKRPRRFSYWTYGQAIGLGQKAVGFANFPFDRAIGPLYTGRAGFWLRHFFVWVLFQLLLLEQSLPGLPFYLGRSMRRERASADA